MLLFNIHAGKSITMSENKSQNYVPYFHIRSYAMQQAVARFASLVLRLLTHVDSLQSSIG